MSVAAASTLELPFWMTLPDPCPKDTIHWALEQFPNLAMTSAFNLNGVVLIDLAAEAGYTGEVLFVDTGYHFAETLATRDALQARYPQLQFVTLDAGLPLNDLYASDPDACCDARKVQPLQRYLNERRPDALLNARSRGQAETRAEIQIVEPGARVKINPLVHWSQERLEQHAARFELPVNPLYQDGFLSVGCWPCTRAVRPGEDPRAGRWAGRGKTECGLWQGSAAL